MTDKDKAIELIAEIGEMKFPCHSSPQGLITEIPQAQTQIIINNARQALALLKCQPAEKLPQFKDIIGLYADDDEPAEKPVLEELAKDVSAYNKARSGEPAEKPKIVGHPPPMMGCLREWPKKPAEKQESEYVKRIEGLTNKLSDKPSPIESKGFIIALINILFEVIEKLDAAQADNEFLNESSDNLAKKLDEWRTKSQQQTAAIEKLKKGYENIMKDGFCDANARFWAEQALKTERKQ